MVAQREQQRMTVEEWRALLDRSPSTKYDYIDGWVYLMAGGSRAHATIAGNAFYLLRSALVGRSCWVYNSDVAVRLSAHRYAFPDVSVTCEPHDRPTVADRELTAPRVIVDVLSETTEGYDRGDKFSYYRACPSVQDYVLIATRRRAVDVFSRTTQGWTAYQAYGVAETIELASIGVQLSIDALYDQTDVPHALDEVEGRV